MASHAVYQVQRVGDGELPSEKLYIEKVNQLPNYFGFDCNYLNYFSRKESLTTHLPQIHYLNLSINLFINTSIRNLNLPAVERRQQQKVLQMPLQRIGPS